MVVALCVLVFGICFATNFYNIITAHNDKRD